MHLLLINITNNQLKTEGDLKKAFHAWNELVYRYIYARLQSREMAEDLTQEVFFRAWEHRDKFDAEKSSLKNWLFVIGTNLLRDFFRKNKIKTESIDENIASQESISEDSKQQSTIECVMKRMKELNEKDQEMLMLRYQLDLSIQEVADIMGMDYSATKVALHRAMKKLKDLCNDVTI